MGVPLRHNDAVAHRRDIAATINAMTELREWTPTIVGTSAAGVGTYTTQFGYYQKIGPMVFVKCNLLWTAHTGTGNMNIGGLPVTSDDVAGSESPVSVWSDEISISANKIIQGFITTDSVLVTLKQVPTGGGSIADVPIDTAGQILISGFYTAKEN
jgi:hypothetical protein